MFPDKSTAILFGDQKLTQQSPELWGQEAKVPSESLGVIESGTAAASAC